MLPLFLISLLGYGECFILGKNYICPTFPFCFQDLKTGVWNSPPGPVSNVALLMKNADKDHEPTEFSSTNKQEKSISPRGFGNEISEVNFKECQEPKDSTSFHDFTTEDIEKLNNVSFSDPEYAGKVRTSSSSSITTIVSLFSFKGVVSCQPCLLLRLHPAVLLSQCTYREVRGQAL